MLKRTEDDGSKKLAYSGQRREGMEQVYWKPRSTRDCSAQGKRRKKKVLIRILFKKKATAKYLEPIDLT